LSTTSLKLVIDFPVTDRHNATGDNLSARRRQIMTTLLESVTVKCPRCRGTGRRPINWVYVRTLELLRRRRDEVNTSRLADMAECSVTAMGNRLTFLESLGLVRSRQDGRQRLWTATIAGSEES
jgi:hypothetical protein